MGGCYPSHRNPLSGKWVIGQGISFRLSRAASGLLQHSWVGHWVGCGCPGGVLGKNIAVYLTMGYGVGFMVRIDLVRVT